MIAENREARSEFLSDHPQCMVPWCSRQSVDTHEITRGISRGTGYPERCTWLALCRLCHDEFDDYSIWPLARQYALKAMMDSDWYDRKRLNAIRRRAEDAIDEVEVINEVLVIQAEFVYRGVE